MNFWLSLIVVVHILVGLAIIGLVLMQHGKGADMGAAFGSGASGSLFGASGSANFLSRATAVLATVFFATSLVLAYVAFNKPKGVDGSGKSVVELNSSSTPAKTGETAGSMPVSGESKAKNIPQ